MYLAVYVAMFYIFSYNSSSDNKSLIGTCLFSYVSRYVRSREKKNSFQKSIYLGLTKKSGTVKWQTHANYVSSKTCIVSLVSKLSGF